MGGSSKKVTVGYRYFVGIHMALCHGPVDSLKRVLVGGKLAWLGTMSGGRLNINAKELFGGEKREGGVSGAIDIEMGKPTQGQNDYLSSKLGSTNLPSFRGVCCAVLRQVYIGLNPYLKDWSWRLQRVHTRQNGIEQWYDQKSAIYCGTLNAKDQINTDTYSDYNICFVLDYSGSMDAVVDSYTGKTRLDLLKQHFKEILYSIAAMPGGINVGMVRFIAGHSMTSRKVYDRADADVLIGFLEAGTGIGTNFEAGMQGAVNFFTANPAKDNVVIFITDGEPNP